MKLIDKSALVAEIKERLKHNGTRAELDRSAFMSGREKEDEDILTLLDILEVKEVEEKFECPNIKVKDSVEVSSRMPHIDKRLLPIAEFIMDYCSWNLHKDEWNQPVLEVPLFRVLDALVQKGKPYCEG